MQKKDFVSLAEARPDLAAEWNYEKNGNLRPEDVTCKSGKKVWWKLPYDVPMDYKVEKLRGKHFEFEWEATISGRSRGDNCPYLSGRAAAWEGFNDLQTVKPELAKQWHPTKNGNLKPNQITSGSNKEIWWLFPYDDHKTGKHFDFEWKNTVKNRNKNLNCPYLTGYAVWEGFNDLQTVNPEFAKQWHPTRNGNLKPNQVVYGSNKKVWWLLPYDDPKTGKHFDFEWKASIDSRIRNNIGCPYLSNRAVWKGFNDLQTTNAELAKQWHPIKNGNLKPNQITSGSNKKIWWLLLYDDSKTGKHFDFEWKASIDSRMSGKYCPFLSGQAVWPGFNDLETVNPELAKQWHPTKNGNLKPNQVTYGSKKKVWWLFPYDDIRTGKHYDFEWTAEIKCRNKNSNCPFIAMSYGEELVKKYLNNMDINFKIQHRFSDLIGTGGRQLSYDFSIPSEKYGLILIEYNGLQHYQSCEFFGGEEKFKKQKEHDRLKKEYAKKHGYKLIIVKYTYDTYEDVAKYLEKELKKSDESVFDSASKTRLHQISNGNSPFFVNEMNGEDIKTAEKEAIKESTKKNKEKIGEIEEEAGENIVYNNEENVA